MPFFFSIGQRPNPSTEGSGTSVRFSGRHFCPVWARFGVGEARQQGGCLAMSDVLTQGARALKT